MSGHLHAKERRRSSEAASQGCTGELGEVVRSGFEVCGNLVRTGDQPWQVVSEFGEAHSASMRATKTPLFRSESYMPQVVGHVCLVDSAERLIGSASDLWHNLLRTLLCAAATIRPREDLQAPRVVERSLRPNIF